MKEQGENIMAPLEPAKSEEQTINPVFQSRPRLQCHYCSRKITLAQSQMPCRCSKLFCEMHSLSAKHECEFDYKATHKARAAAAAAAAAANRKSHFHEKDDGGDAVT